jgi:tetratricopeptide (TPR) repeat protein
MKFCLFTALLLAGLICAARAQSAAEDQYIGICGLIEQAGRLDESASVEEAFAAYVDAQKHLQRFQKIYPDWNPNIVNFRLSQLAGKIGDLKSRLPPPVAAMLKTNAAPAAEKVEPALAPAPVAPPEPATESEAPSSAVDLDQLRAQLREEQAANAQLQAKLKEALATRPAAVDPAELARAQEKIRWLMKQNDLLMISHGAVPAAQETRVVTNFVVVTNFTTVVVTNGPVEVTNLAAVFAKNSPPTFVTNTLTVTNFVRTVIVDTNAMEKLKLERAAALKSYGEEHARAEQLAGDLQTLRQASARVSATNDAATLAALRAENAALKSKLEQIRSASLGLLSADDALKLELKQSRERIATLQSEAQIAALEKLALQHKLETLLTTTNSSAAYEARIRQLTNERNDLMTRLDAANKSKTEKNSDMSKKLGALNLEVTELRSRLAVAETQPVPYTAEELALLRSATPPLAEADAGRKSIKEMPAGTAELIHSAQGHFDRREFDQAEADYEKILNRDQNNGFALANLASIEMQQNKLSEAEQHITAALKQSPDDPFNLATCGQLKVRQEKYSEALNYLSRAAQAEPNNPDIQNFLGLALGHLGQRKAAETALRRAIQLVPNYAAAHNNLAVVYLTQDPPSPELARWHYQKAINAGQPRNPDLEKLLAEKGAPVQ